MYRTMMMALDTTLGTGTIALRPIHLDRRRYLADQPARLRQQRRRHARRRLPDDGGQPAWRADLKGKAIKVVDVPKLIGIGYFNATSKGIADAAKELGNVDAKTDGPTQANIDQQITFSSTVTSPAA